MTESIERKQINEEDFEFYILGKPITLTNDAEWIRTRWSSIPDAKPEWHDHSKCNPHTHVHPNSKPIRHSHAHPVTTHSDPTGQFQPYSIYPHTHTNGLTHAHPHTFPDPNGVIDPLPGHYTTTDTAAE